MSKCLSFLVLDIILLYIYTVFHLSTHLLVDICVPLTFWPLWIIQLWAWVYKYLFITLLPILLDLHTEVILLDHIVVIFLILWGTSLLFSIAALPFYTSTNSAEGFQFLYILGNTCDFLCFFFFFSSIVVITVDVRWYLIVILISISLMIDYTEHCFLCLLPIFISSLKKCLFKLIALLL